ncbi:uncharacterized protein [Hetaerina americana]|uniref:uncharacterized protein n=1 Tax=Hetaerina americana TaxID=62018 RepID=UPI003A7F347A
MSDQIDEDSLSVQLESSLTLEDVEDIPNTACSHGSPVRPGGRKSILDSVLSPDKVSPFKVDKDLRKEVLIRNLITSPKKDEGLATDFNSSSSDDKDRMHPEEQDEPEAKENILCADVMSNVDITSKSEDIETFGIQKEECIIVDEIPAANSLVVGGGESLASSPVLEKEEKSIKKPRGLEVDYVSKDPLENADNNNPDWQLLQKLETDEERYKAVRERWRNLIVPEPNKDLTCFAWCRKKNPEPKDAQNLKTTPKKDDSSCVTEEDYCKGRKRTFSACAIDSPVRRGRDIKSKDKRVRTVSCTRVYDEKIATLRRHASEECLRIDRERNYALEGLQTQYLSDKRSLSSWSLSTGYSISKELNELDRYHYQKRRNISDCYEDLASRVWERKASEITTLEAAASEVLVFHKFYQGLDDKAPESMVLTEDQMDEIQEINRMYDDFHKFYEE